MTNVGANDLVTRVQTLLRGTARKEPSDVERTAIKFVQNPTFSHAVDLLVEINKQPGVRPYRPAVLRACIKAMQLCQSSTNLTFAEAAVRIREQNRILGSPLPKRAVGSTLLLKGLEADVAVVLNADKLDVRNLYVAMTRGCRRLIICSKSPILNPS
jgi:DNA helicase-2/ATP-dependent DNA helicase PcrA